MALVLVAWMGMVLVSRVVVRALVNMRQEIVLLRMEVGMGEQLKREVENNINVYYNMVKNNELNIIGQKRKRKDCNGSDELSTILTKFIEVTEENDTKRRLVEAELEEKRREQERKHEERMMTMMMTFMQRIVGVPPTPQQPQSPSTSFPAPSYPFTPGQDFRPPPFTTDRSFTDPNPPVSPPYYDDDCSY